jgi:hypothetical protein
MTEKEARELIDGMEDGVDEIVFMKNLLPHNIISITYRKMGDSIFRHILITHEVNGLAYKQLSSLETKGYELIKTK